MKKIDENEEKFYVCIIGTDFNAYFMARNFYEEYKVKSHLFGKIAIDFTTKSKILDITIVENIWDNDVFMKLMENFANTHTDKPIILIGTNDRYVKMIAKNAEKLKENFLFNYSTYDLVCDLLVKDKFYTKYSNKGVEFPKTYIYSCLSDDKVDEKAIESLGFPLIVKPGDGIELHMHDYVNEAKVHKIHNIEQLHEVIKNIKDCGYKENLVIQEYIPGGDCNLFDAVTYVAKDGTVEFMTFAQIGLQERTSGAIGNCTVLVNGFNEFGQTKKVVDSLKKFIQEIGYRGAGEIDIKYDIRDNKFKVLEINPRQGRSSYYTTACGYNIAKYIVDDVMYNKYHKFKVVNEKYALSFVPLTVIKKYVESPKLKEELIKLSNVKKIVNPLDCPADNSFYRKWLLFLRRINYIKKYKNNVW